jgi:hypothetical protein
MRNLTVYLVLAFSIANLPTYGQDATSASDSTSTFNIVIDAETREAIANGDSEAVVAVLAAANVDPNDPDAISKAVKQIVDLVENPPKED